MAVLSRARARVAGSAVLTTLAVLVVWFALVAPNKITTPSTTTTQTSVPMSVPSEEVVLAPRIAREGTSAQRHRVSCEGTSNPLTPVL